MSPRREELVLNRSDIILLESYVATDGPTIHIDVRSLDRLNELGTIMQDLANGRSQSVALSSMAGTQWVSPLEEILLTVSDNCSDIRNQDHGGRLVCFWTDSIEGWLESADKLYALATFGHPCHQYFDGKQANSVTVELAFME